MSLPSPRRVLLLVGLSATVGACDPDKGGDSGSEPDGTTGIDDTSDPDDTSDTGDTAPPEGELVAERVLDVVPATLPESVGGTVTARLAAGVVSAGDDAPSLEALVAAGSFTARLPDDSEVDVAAEVGADDTLTLRLSVPGGLASEAGARVGIAVSLDGRPWAEVPVGLHVDPTPLLEGFTGDRTGLVPSAEGSGAPLRTCGSFVVDGDGDGLVEVLTVGLDDEGFRLTGCRATDTTPVSWECEDQILSPTKGGDLFCGETSHFRSAGGDVGILAAAVDDEGRTHQLSGVSWGTGGWGGGGSVDEVAAMGLFAVVIGFNNTKESPEVPLSAMVGAQGGAGDWTGAYQEGRTAWSWTSLGTVTATELGDGTAWAGFAGDRGLWGTSGGDSLVWTYDPGRADDGGSIVVDVLSVSPETRSFPRLRQVALEGPGFAVEAVAGAFGDLDADGVPELVIEAWGEGRWAAWLVRGATDKSDARKVVELTGGPSEGVAYPRVSLSGRGTVASSFLVGGATGDTLTAAVPVLVGAGPAADHAPTQVDLLDVTWDVAALLDAEGGPVAASGTTLGGVLARGTPDEKRTGLCCYGRCFNTPGFEGSSRFDDGGGDGSAVSTLAQGELVRVGVDPGDASLVVARRGRPGAPKGQVRSPKVRAMTVVSGDEGPEVVIEGAPLLATTWSALLAAVGSDEDEDFVLFSFEPTYAAPESADAAPTVQHAVRIGHRGAEGRVRLPEATTVGGSSVPQVLSEALSDEGGVLLGWRDGGGQAWLAVVDVAAAAGARDGATVPLLHGPVAVGAPLSDPDDTLGLGGAGGGGGMVFLRTDPIADTPFFSMEDLEERFASWDEPMEVPFTSGEGRYGSVALTVGTEDGGVETLYLPPTDQLDTLDESSLVPAGALGDATLVPRLAATLVPDAPPLLVLVSPDGHTQAHLVDATGSVAATTSLPTFDAEALREGHLSAADLNGDGATDLLLAHGSSSELVLSDGAGKSLSHAVDSTQLTNLGRVLPGGGPGSESPLDPAGGRGLAVGGPSLGPWDLEGE